MQVRKAIILKIKKSLLFQVGFPLMTFALIIKVYCCLKQPYDLTEILKNKKDLSSLLNHALVRLFNHLPEHLSLRFYL
ncbi:hypothetical protein CTY88_12530 [Acinetobacter seifertii]|nr:hypothetical protein [Acinetobacter seifertii]